MGKSSLPHQALGLGFWLGVTGLAAAVAGAGSVSAPALYARLALPAWAPPGWVFGPVWTVLYALMGISAWVVWRARGFSGARFALLLYILQLAVNVLWSWLFFHWQFGFLALTDILLLLGLLLATLTAFWRIHPLAGWLLSPYLLWVGFAAALNLAIWQLNPEILG
ncbi:TspO/MBR family protein [Desulfohalobium retbaense]|uniref:TspO and MBR like protein n=1 Tax=Desulfohalobium retbaense (strain ATCC 49708 / DSM 5692 / JCM 16813 / HR100) TaxID=485915 RepID=C8X315_DESRD|nr:TspO/MBR family protein [Desulfohalobium retbaense]ACV68812.1 TspO and MBR like protein [Desulfohalobium retbaense DSM 5692]